MQTLQPCRVCGRMLPADRHHFVGLLESRLTPISDTCRQCSEAANQRRMYERRRIVLAFEVTPNTQGYDTPRHILEQYLCEIAVDAGWDPREHEWQECCKETYRAVRRAPADARETIKAAERTIWISAGKQRRQLAIAKIAGRKK